MFYSSLGAASTGMAVRTEPDAFGVPWSGMPPSTDPLPRERLGPYRLVRRLGLGGMGETYEAESAGGDRVCLKTIRPDLAGDARYVRMFEDEMRIHAQLRDEHIVRVLDTGEAGGTPFLVLEMVSGMSL